MTTTRMGVRTMAVHSPARPCLSAPCTPWPCPFSTRPCPALPASKARQRSEQRAHPSHRPREREPFFLPFFLSFFLCSFCSALFCSSLSSSSFLPALGCRAWPSSSRASSTPLTSPSSTQPIHPFLHSFIPSKDPTSLLFQGLSCRAPFLPSLLFSSLHTPLLACCCNNLAATVENR